MPEAPELRLTDDFINLNTAWSKVNEIKTSDKTKNPKFDLDRSKLVHMRDLGENPYIYAYSRGKELMLHFDGNNNEIFLRMTMGMSGHFQLTDENESLPKHAHLQIYLEDGNVLSYVDARRFGKWKILTDMEWSKNRGPSVFDQIEFEHHFMDHLNEPKVQNAYLLDIIMSQRLFNGIGNYLRAEIFDRADINPFLQVKDLSSLEIIKLLKMCTSVAEESYKLGGGQLKDWKNPNGQDPTKFRDWIKVYGKAESCQDRTGRRFWYDVKWQQTISYEYYCINRPISSKNSL